MIKKAFLVLIITSVATLVACKKDNEKIPELPIAKINLGEIGTSIKVLETIDYSLEATFPVGLKSGSAVVWLDDIPIDTVFDSGKDSLLLSLNQDFSIEVLPKYSGGNLLFTFSVTDLLDQTAGDTIALSVEESVIQLIDNIEVAGYENFDLGSFINVKGDTAYFSSNIKNSTTLKQSVDLVFFFTTDDKRILAPPASNLAEISWKDQSSSLWPLFGSENETVLFNLGSTIDYDAIITGAQIASILNGKVSVDSVTNIAPGIFIGFELSSGRGKNQGIIKVTGTGGNSTSSATMTFDAKIQR